MKKSIVSEKAFWFGVSLVKVIRVVMSEKKEFILTRQVIRSGTSVGANCHEAIQAASKKDFAAKMNIALKEAQETHYWLRLLKETEFLPDAEFMQLQPECEELIKMLTSIVKTTRENLEKNK